MKLKDIMSTEVEIVRPDASIQEAAEKMASLDVGALPVCDGRGLIGMITDRDIAIRGVGQGKGPKTKVRDIMTKDLKYCFDDQGLDEVTQNMADIQVRRLPVIDHDKRLVGILSLGDIAMKADGKGAIEALSGISRPGGEHTQAG